MKTTKVLMGVLTLAASLTPAWAQDGGGWRRFGDRGQAPDRGQGMAAPQQNYAPPTGPLTVPAGKFLVVRTTNWLSTDHSQGGDAFTATLADPLVVDGFVVAQRGQIIEGRVTAADKGGRVKGVSKLGLELTQFTAVDGQQIPLHSQLIQRSAGTSTGRDAGGVIGTTAVGAAIGAGVNGGVGAGVGAGAGLVVGVLGVLLTRGHPTVVPPETLLTFRIEQPVTISTERSANAFLPVSRDDYARNLDLRPSPPQERPQSVGIYGSPYPYYNPYWGPSFAFGYGYGGGWGYGRGYGYGHYGRGRRW